MFAQCDVCLKYRSVTKQYMNDYVCNVKNRECDYCHKNDDCKCHQYDPIVLVDKMLRYKLQQHKIRSEVESAWVADNTKKDSFSTICKLGCYAGFLNLHGDRIHDSIERLLIRGIPQSNHQKYIHSILLNHLCQNHAWWGHDDVYDDYTRVCARLRALQLHTLKRSVLEIKHNDNAIQTIITLREYRCQDFAICAYLYIYHGKKNTDQSKHLTMLLRYMMVELGLRRMEPIILGLLRRYTIHPDRILKNVEAKLQEYKLSQLPSKLRHDILAIGIELLKVYGFTAPNLMPDISYLRYKTHNTFTPLHRDFDNLHAKGLHPWNIFTLWIPILAREGTLEFPYIQQTRITGPYLFHSMVYHQAPVQTMVNAPRISVDIRFRVAIDQSYM